MLIADALACCTFQPFSRSWKSSNYGLWLGLRLFESITSAPETCAFVKKHLKERTNMWYHNMLSYSLRYKYCLIFPFYVVLEEPVTNVFIYSADLIVLMPFCFIYCSKYLEQQLVLIDC